ncbi:protoporphyrinogen oxidase [Antrihabitans spumae]|uniref:Protoporphyrinogen oxidase n=1 Tax=Antrihabitans spumae TaxID=3373370 RepID=A0ABW7K541_9NOCA
MTSVAVVGAGISGLVAAYRLRQALGPTATITLVEASDRIGGKLRTVPLGDGVIDIGAEAFVGRRPEVPDLLAELGIADQLVHPAGLRPLVWAGGALHPLPTATLMGIPSSRAAVEGLVDDATLARIDAEPATPFRWDRDSDVDVGSLVADRFGEQVVRRSVDPLLGGVYSGLSSSIGVRAALPTLAAALDAGARSLTEAVVQALPPPMPGPVFGGIRDGYAVLLDALLAAADPVVELGMTVRSIERSGSGWQLEPLGRFDGVVLALPATAIGRLLAAVAPSAAAAAAAIPLASSALVGLALPAGIDLPQHSGVLVATGEALRAKAFTFSSRKWPHLAERGVALVRASFGRYGDSVSDAGDADLIATATEDLATVTGVSVTPVDAVVQHWSGGLPQYLPGHLDRVGEIESGLADVAGLEVAGAFLRGVGVPACISAGSAAAARLLAAVH